MTTINLRKPLMKDGQPITVLKIDLDSLKGSDLLRLEHELRAKGNLMPNPLMSTEGYASVAAKASGYLLEDIEELSAPDFMQVTNTVSNFLYDWVLPTALQSKD